MIGFLLKGIFRDRSRTLFPILTVALGSCLTVVMYSWIAGALSDSVKAGANFGAGHVKVMTRGYAAEAARLPNDLALLGTSELIARLEKEFPALVWTSRIGFQGLLDIPDEAGETRAQGPATGMAVDLLSPASPEPGLLNLEKALVRGRLPEKTGEILLSDDFARRLGIEPGGKATLMTSTMNGSLSVQNFTMAGTVRFGIGVMDRGAVIADLGDARAALDMDDGAGEILGFFRDSLYRDKEARATAAAFNAEAPAGTGGDDTFTPVMVTLRDQPGLAQMLNMATAVYGVILLVFITAMSIVLWNAGLMAGLRRYGEFGIRLALGEDKGHLYRMLIAESLMIGAVGSVLGTALGLAAAYPLQAHGINLASMMKNASVVISDVLRARVTLLSWVIGFVPGLAATFIGRALSGLAVFRRQTAGLTKEFEA